MAFWEKIKKDVQKGFREGITVIRERAEELTEEGRKKYRLFELKNKVHKEMSDLGGAVYEARKKTRNPMVDSKVKAIVDRIARLEDQLDKLEGKAKKAARKKTVAKKKRKTSRKKTPARSARGTSAKTAAKTGGEA
jgi:hypothetical protein